MARLLNSSIQMKAIIYGTSADGALGMNASASSPSTLPSVPTTRNGLRRPQRVRTRSLQAPNSGATTIEANAPIMGSGRAWCP